MNTVTLIQSLILTAVGMIVVFAFMGALILIVHFYVALAARFFPDKEKDAGANSGANVSTETKDAEADSPERVAAAIAAAIAATNATRTIK